MTHSEMYILRILHECEVMIKKNLSQGSQFGIMRDRFEDQFLPLMIDSFSCTPMDANT